MEQKETEKPPADATHRAGLAGSIAGAIGWFGGSLGAIGVMLYACGYLISIAQLHLLGIGRLVSYSHDYYVQTGGSFVADLGSTLGTGAAFVGKELVAFVVLVVGATVILYRTKLRRLAWVVRLRGWWQRAAVVWQPAIYAILLYLLLFGYGDPVRFGRPLTLADVLFVDPPASAGPELTDIHIMLMTGDTARLGGQFEDHLVTYLIVCLLGFAAYHVTATWRRRRLAMAPFALIVLLYTLLLPMLYGVLKLQLEFPVVVLWSGGEAKTAEPQRGFLLNLGEHEAIIYLPSQRSVTWRRREQIDRIDVVAVAPVLRGDAAGKETR